MEVRNNYIMNKSQEILNDILIFLENEKTKCNTDVIGTIDVMYAQGQIKAYDNTIKYVSEKISKTFKSC